MSTDSGSLPHVSNEDLAAYLDGTLDQERRAIVESHLADCDRCRWDMLDVRGLLADLPATEQAPRRTPRRRRSAAWIATGAVAAGIIFSAALLRMPARDQARPSVERGAAVIDRIAVVTPAADRVVDGPNAVFVWRAIEGGGTYRLTIMDSAGARLWTTSTRDTTTSIPIKPPFARGRNYLWYVDALASDGHTVTSGARSFSTGP
ncbi:MAG TPA: zf-HC2 domain-containing protein [Gemmatimonadaceae bacterium]|jgi:hypothetical protein